MDAFSLRVLILYTTAAQVGGDFYCDSEKPAQRFNGIGCDRVS